MTYCLHVFVYDIHGDVDAPLILPNWNESIVIPISLDRKDEFLGKKIILFTATQAVMDIVTPMTLKLGKINKDRSPISSKLKVLATMAPVLARESKYSASFSSFISYT